MNGMDVVITLNKMLIDTNYAKIKLKVIKINQ